MLERKHVLMFPGQASQSVGMGKDLAQDFREFAHTLEEASDALELNMSTLLFEDPNAQLNLTEYTQPAVLTMSVGIMRILQEHAGLSADVVAGHSLGEYSALVALGALRFAEAVKAVRFRGQAMQKAVPVGVGAMAAYLGSQWDAVEEICSAESKDGDVVQPVNFNCPGQVVISGHKSAVERVLGQIQARKLGKAIVLPVSAPFHSSLMKPAADAMASYLANVELLNFKGRIVANVDAKFHDASNYSRETLVSQIASPVLWTQTLNTIQAEMGEAVWIEVGPGNVLQGFCKKTIAGCETLGTATSESVKALLSRAG